MAKRRKKRARPPLDDRHRLAIELLTSVPRPTREEIGRRCGVCRRTLHRWERRKDFQKELRKVQNRKSAEYRRRLRQRKAQILAIGDIEQMFRTLQLIP